MKATALRILLSILLFPVCGFTQIQFNFSGYIIDLPVFQRNNQNISQLFQFNRDQQFNITRLRLRPTIEFNAESRLSIEYEVTTFYQSQLSFSQVALPRAKRQLFDLNWTLLDERHWSSQHFIDRFYYRQEFDFGQITIGRQRIAWGSGRIWNPTDLFNPINPANFAKIEKDGADLITGKFYLGDFTDLTLVFNPQEKNRSNAGVRCLTNLYTYDFSIVSGIFDERIIMGGDFAGNLFKAGFRGEAIISGKKDDFGSNFARYILGLDYQFTARLYTLMEYQFNGDGSKDKRKYNLLKLLQGEILNVAKNYLFISANYLLYPLVSSSLSINLNLDDNSGYFLGMINYSAGQNTYLGLGGQFFFGDNLDEYWYFPNSGFLKIEFYF